MAQDGHIPPSPADADNSDESNDINPQVPLYLAYVLAAIVAATALLIVAIPSRGTQIILAGVYSLIVVGAYAIGLKWNEIRMASPGCSFLILLFIVYRIIKDGIDVSDLSSNLLMVAFVFAGFLLGRLIARRTST